MEMKQERPIRVLAADDSAVMRGIMAKLFGTHAQDRLSELPRMELCGMARDGMECLESVKQLQPDVLVLDLEMPKLNGLDVLDRLRADHSKLPVIMCSSYTEYGARSTLEALARGASDYVTKPAEQRDFASAMQSLSRQLLPRIAALAKDTVRKGEVRAGSSIGIPTAGLKVTSTTKPLSPIEVIVIGLSTGGPAALEQLLPSLPADFPVPVLIVQHMPKLFTGALAERLDRCCALRVEQAYDDAMIRPGTIWLAPGDAHMEVAPRRKMAGEEGGVTGMRGGRVRLHQQEPLNHCRPSVDYLFYSAARMYGAGALALMMTGMGSDGLDGARAIHHGGGVVLAQDEASSAVWGMPGRVSEAGIADATLPLSAIAGALRQRVSEEWVTKHETGSRHPAVETARREVQHGLL
jgi:two-component system, chemotaxis family, protein-glutamate methylesterase/glutaminase